MNRCKWKDVLKRSWIYKQCRKRMRILKEGWNATPNLGCSTKMSILPVPKRNGEAGRYGFQEAPVHIYGPALFETANRAILYTVDWTRRQNSWASNIAILGQGCAQRQQWILLDKDPIGFKYETMMLPALYPTPTPFPAVAAWNGYENTKIDGIRSPTLDDLLVLLFSCLYSLMEG